MKIALFTLALAHAVICGNLRGALSPAGVTYVDGSYHAGLAAGPVSYSTSVSAAPVEFASAPASVSISGPVTRYAAVQTVQHVPGVAHVPVTRINAQPAVVQKTFDVASPALKTQRFEVRRPAIQKQFYDIEERVVVRPAGSAVVELDEPISRTQKGPSVIQRTGGSVAVAGRAVTVPTGPAVSSTSVSGNSFVTASAPGQAGSFESVSAGQGSVALPPAAPSQTVSFSAPSFSVQNSAAFPPAAPTPSSVYGAPGFSSLHSAAHGQTVSISAPSFSVQNSAAPTPSSAYGAPGFSRQHSAARGQTVSFSAPASSVQTSTVLHQAPAHSVSVSAPVESVSVSAPVQTVSISAPVQTSSVATPVQSTVHTGSSGFSFSTPAPSYSAGSVSEFQTVGFSGPQSYATHLSAPSFTLVRNNGFESSHASGQISGHGSVQSAPAQQNFGGALLYSAGNAQSQINHENQQRFIQLLTARGGVTELGFGRSGSFSSPAQAGGVRARVVSATPAPAFAAPTEEKVNTRRVVVSRPIETVQDVEVSQQVTKLDRVHVAQPTIIKTASQGVVSVPTSVPVYGKAFAPIVEKGHGWQ